MESDTYEPPTTSARVTRAGGRREREFRRYAEAVLYIRQSTQDAAAVSSVDVPLTAFAQLVALRLGAKRVLVSLFDKKHQYILAEATASLSLQEDTDHEDGDALFFGRQVLPRRKDWFCEALSVARKHIKQRKQPASVEDAVLVIPDMLMDDRYSQHPLVTGGPMIRSYVGVPLLSPSGYSIGILSVLDDKTRENAISRTGLKILRDVSTSIMTHLELARTKSLHERALHMVQGLSRFIEGKHSLADNPIHAEQSAEQVSDRLQEQTGRLGGSARTHAMNAASNNERIDEARVMDAHSGPTRDRSYSDERRPSRHGIPDNHGESTSKRKDSVDTDALKPPEPTESTTASRLQDKLLSEDVTQAFQRAATLIQQALAVDGVLILDASAGEFGSLRNPSSEETDGSPNSSDGAESPGSTHSTYSRRSATGSGKRKPCRYLASAYAAGVDVPSHVLPVPEKLLRSLMRRFPHGKIYNFGEDGLLSSDDHSDHSCSGQDSAGTRSTTSTRTKNRKRTQYSDSLDLAKLMPGVRSFAMLPMWDSSKSRFLASAIVWSCNPLRLFSFADDLNYLSAFCDILMTEVARLEIQADAKSKATFIASISHELRSPLHGILGGAEVLQEDDDDEGLRQQMVQMIDSCGRSLLDIVNNLLEHAQATSGNRTDSKKGSRKRAHTSTKLSEPTQDLAILTEQVLQSVLWNTPKPAKKHGPPGLSAQSSASVDDDPVKVILEIDVEKLTECGWSFRVNAGAYRRILQNLASNALKYTDNGGFCKCRLSVLEAPADRKPATIELECSDSGRGMSDSYLKHGIWQAFNQEDANAQGTGLGLSIVRKLVEEMGGTIDVRSTQGVGTCVKVLFHLLPGEPSAKSLLSSGEAAVIQGLTYKLIGFDPLPGQDGKAGFSNNVLKSSLDKTCRYLRLRPVDTSLDPDAESQIYIVSGRRARAAARLPPQHRPDWQARPCIVLCESVAASRKLTPMLNDTFRQAIAVSQPLGPRQLLQSLTLCWNKVPQDLDRLNPRKDRTASFSAAPTPDSDLSELNWAADRAQTPAIEEANPLHSPEPSTSEGIERKPRLLKRASVLASASSVLLVDDNSVNLTLLQRYMTKLKRTYIGAMDGQEAVNAYKTHHAPKSLSHHPPSASPPQLPISVIFMDITMPVMDGLEATRRIRSYERQAGLSPVMIVALTALDSAHAEQEAYSSGVDLYMTKPVGFKDIQRMFRDWEVEIDG